MILTFVSGLSCHTWSKGSMPQMRNFPCVEGLGRTSALTVLSNLTKGVPLNLKLGVSGRTGLGSDELKQRKPSLLLRDDRTPATVAQRLPSYGLKAEKRLRSSGTEIEVVRSVFALEFHCPPPRTRETLSNPQTVMGRHANLLLGNTPERTRRFWISLCATFGE